MLDVGHVRSAAELGAELGYRASRGELELELTAAAAAAAAVSPVAILQPP